MRLNQAHLWGLLLWATLGCGKDGGDADGSSGGDTGSSGDAGEGDEDLDNDGDGFTNGEEELAGTNPDYDYSHPYEGGYNVGWCETPYDATGPTGSVEVESSSGSTVSWNPYQLGDVPTNFTMPDHYDEPVDLYSFCGKHIVLVLSAGWCGPCRSAAAEMQAMQDEYRDDGVQFIEMITGDNSDAVPDLAFVQSWASEYAFVDIPVLQAPAASSWTDETVIWDRDFGIPSVWHIDPTGTIVSADDLIHDPGEFL